MAKFLVYEILNMGIYTRIHSVYLSPHDPGIGGSIIQNVQYTEGPVRVPCDYSIIHRNRAPISDIVERTHSGQNNR